MPWSKKTVHAARATLHTKPRKGGMSKAFAQQVIAEGTMETTLGGMFGRRKRKKSKQG